LSVDQAVTAGALVLAGGLGLACWNFVLRRQVKRQEEHLFSRPMPAWAMRSFLVGREKTP